MVVSDDRQVEINEMSEIRVHKPSHHTHPGPDPPSTSTPAKRPTARPPPTKGRSHESDPCMGPPTCPHARTQGRQPASQPPRPHTGTDTPHYQIANPTMRNVRPGAQPQRPAHKSAPHAHAQRHTDNHTHKSDPRPQPPASGGQAASARPVRPRTADRIPGKCGETTHTPTPPTPHQFLPKWYTNFLAN